MTRRTRINYKPEQKEIYRERQALSQAILLARYLP